MALPVVLVVLALILPGGSPSPVYHPATTYRPLLLQRLAELRGSARGCRALTAESAPPQPPPGTSPSLSDEELEQLLTVVNVVGTERGGTVAKLSLEEYQGRRRLVYRLAPGPVFAGVRRRGAVNDDERRPGASKGLNTGPAEGKHMKRPHSVKALQHHPPSPTPVPEHLPRPQPHPYVSGAPSDDLYVLTDGLMRNQLRGAWLSFLLMHFLGFIPELPGMPRHRDPAKVKHTEFHTLSRSQ